MRPYLEVEASSKAVVVVWATAVLLPLLIVLLVVLVAVAEVVAVGVIFVVVTAVAVVAVVVEGDSPSRACLGFRIYEVFAHNTGRDTRNPTYYPIFRYGLYVYTRITPTWNAAHNENETASRVVRRHMLTHIHTRTLTYTRPQAKQSCITAFLAFAQRVA